MHSEEGIVQRLRTKSADAILAYLALHKGQSIQRTELEELGWPESQTQQRQQSLRTALASIRKLFGADVLDSDRSTVRLNPDHFEVDALEFRAGGGLSLYKGRLLEGLECEWAAPFALELEEIYVKALSDEMDRLPPDEAIRLGREALKRDPESVLIRSKLKDIERSESPPRFGSSPFVLSSFIGRERELDEIAALLENNRLVTLIGLGGTGKTRLAVELWQRKRPNSWFVALADLTDSGFFGEALRQGLKLPSSSHLNGLDQVTSALSEEQGLLVLDNFEQILEAAPFVELLLAGCPGLKILTTSRVGLGLASEVEYSVGPMSVASSRAGELSESAELFLDRARAALPGFTVSADNLAAIEVLCSRLDGFPLSLEFAAAKSRIFSPAEMVKQLDDRFEFLVAQGRKKTKRQSSLIDALDWSFDRLSPPLQTLLCRLSIFEGGFTLDAAARICDADRSGSEVEALLTSAWIQRTSSSGPTRFRMLESIRDYGSALLKRGELKALKECHASYYLDLGVRCMDASFMPEEPMLHALVRDDTFNIEAAYRQFKATDPEAALTMICSLNWYWIVYGQAHLGEERMREALQKADQTPRQNLGRGHHHLGNFLLFQGRFAEAEQWFTKAYKICVQVGDLLFQGLAACQLGRVLAELGRDEEANCQVDESMRCLLQVQDDNWICAGYTIRCLISNRAGDAETALESGRLAVEYARRGGYQWGLASCLNELAMALHLAGDYAASIKVQEESMELKRGLETWPALIISLADIAATYAAMGNRDQAKASVIECALLLKRLNNHENYPKVFATAAEILWESGSHELARQALGKMIQLTEGRRVSASEVEARDRAIKLFGVPGPLVAGSSKEIVNAIASL